MKIFLLNILATIVAISYASPDALLSDEDLLIKEISWDLIDAYHKYAPGIRVEIEFLRKQHSQVGKTMTSLQLRDKQKHIFSLESLTDFEKDLPDGNLFYVGKPILDELTPRIASKLGEKFNEWVPNSQDYVKFIQDCITSEPRLSFKISETNLFEGLRINDETLVD